ncbi:SHOCT domain-containing protein [Weissella koreensis]|uniref:SHOCT domain-containing protein n=1 Tax=Weissella koreensis TaxID=165096 RepID=A0A7H1MKZ1_9LACO|nr:SHOCT domain-containing protein [Weissella koreensis]QNT64127.1 SHOCT domain-containing protein [Weissella koreensis]
MNEKQLAALKNLKELLDDGILTADEFSAQKKEIIEGSKKSDSGIVNSVHSSADKLMDNKTIQGTKDNINKIMKSDKVKNTSKKVGELVDKIPLNKDTKSKLTGSTGKNIIKGIVGVIVLVIVIVGFNFIHNAPTRKQTKLAESYLADGKYGDAQKAYQKLQEMHPNDTTEKEYSQVSKLAEITIDINNGNFAYDNGSFDTPTDEAMKKLNAIKGDPASEEIKTQTENTIKTLQDQADNGTNEY